MLAVFQAMKLTSRSSRSLTLAWCLACVIIMCAVGPSTARAASSGVSSSGGSASRFVDPDFAAMALSAEEEEKLIIRPAAQEMHAVPSRPVVKPKPPPPPKKVEEPALVQLALSGRTALGDLCKQLPVGNAPSPTGGSLTQLSRLLRGLWESSGLLEVGGDDQLVRVRLSEAQRALLHQALSAPHHGDDLREEDLPEVMETTMAIVHSMEVDREAVTHLHTYRSMLASDEMLADEAPRPSWIWRQASRALVFLHLHPGVAEEFDAFWAILVGTVSLVAAMGVGFAWGVRSDRKSLLGVLDATIRNGVDGQQVGVAGPSAVGSTGSGLSRARVRSPRQVFCANFCWVLFWIFLGVVALFLIGYVHLFLEIQTENRALAAVAKSKPVPRACVMSAEEIAASQSFGSRLLDIAGSFTQPRLQATLDPCVKYWQEYHRSTTPNPAFVLTRFLSRSILDPLTMAMEALGEGSYKFLGHHSFFSQVMLLGFVLLLIIGLAWTGGLGSLWCCCRGGGGGGGSARYSRRREESRRYYLEDATDDSEVDEARAASRARNNHHRRIEDRERDRHRSKREAPLLLLREEDSADEEDRVRSSSDRTRGARRHHERSSRHRSRSRSFSRSRSPAAERKSSRARAASPGESSTSRPLKSKAATNGGASSSTTASPLRASEVRTHEREQIHTVKDEAPTPALTATRTDREPADERTEE